ncbi:GH10142 [Drosophila grimshawi]|uniref:GH10142 n=1 Tax=Drosophila grimshawi TaxID=7222 RepID=B4JCA9_DROGR|nr:GH10142 [Drosophila grimshawi]
MLKYCMSELGKDGDEDEDDKVDEDVDANDDVIVGADDVQTGEVTANGAETVCANVN